ncbi:hypothetical protein BT69DRAFT_1300271 [Atractiella rhizophila]|nr:hypothetical protein BT69DRAFT_1300271 [Atractiella rhizophila]
MFTRLLQLSTFSVLLDDEEKKTQEQERRRYQSLLVAFLLQVEGAALSLPRERILLSDIKKRGRFFTDYSCDDIQYHCRFTLDEIETLVNLLHLPDILLLDNGIKVDIFEAFCIMLKRLAYADRLGIIAESPDELEKWADATLPKGCPVEGIIAFLDGTIQPIARPSKNQETVGCISHLTNLTLGPNGKRYMVYGDCGYGCIGDVLTAGFKNSQDTDELSFNEPMSKLRIAVEWNLGMVRCYWSWLNWEQEQKIRQRLLLTTGLNDEEPQEEEEEQGL